MDITQNELLALKAVRRGCNTNRHLVGSSYVLNFGSSHEQTISYYDAIKIVDEIIEQAEQALQEQHSNESVSSVNDKYNPRKPIIQKKIEIPI